MRDTPARFVVAGFCVKAPMSKIAFTGAALIAVATTSNADLPNDRWGYSDPVTTGGEWTDTGNRRSVGAATFAEWERETTTTREALNPAGIPVGTDRFDDTAQGSETTERNVNAGPPPS